VKSTLVGLGIYYGLFGFYGIYSVTRANLGSGQFSSLLFGSLAFAFSVLTAVLLIGRKTQRAGLICAVVLSAAQIVKFAWHGFAYEFQAGAMIGWVNVTAPGPITELSASGFFANLGSGAWLSFSNNYATRMFGMNLFALALTVVLVVLLTRMPKGPVAP